MGMVTRVRALSDRAPAKNGSSREIAALVVHGPNLNLLGEREPEVYGYTRLADIDRELKQLGRELEIKVETFQSNSEGAIVDRIQRARGRARALVINPAAYTHTSVAIRDAIRSEPRAGAAGKTAAGQGGFELAAVVGALRRWWFARDSAEFVDLGGLPAQRAEVGPPA